MNLSIIIVNYKTPDLLLRCINSILNTIPKELLFEMIIVDNNSNDNSEKIIKTKFEDIIWIQKNENDGFGRANNIGIQKAIGEYVLLLNSDIVVAENTILECLKEIEKDKTIGVLSCKLLNDDGSNQKSIYHYAADYLDVLNNNLIFDYFIKIKPKKIKALMGSFLLIPQHVLQNIGLFDPDFFMYCEELELCNRILKKGYKIKYIDNVVAYHKHGASSTDENWVIKQKYLSNALLVYKLKGLFGYIFYHFLCVLNSISNFFAMWFLDKKFRKDFLNSEKCFYTNFFYYFVIPFKYSRNIGDGKRILRRN